MTLCDIARNTAQCCIHGGDAAVCCLLNVPATCTVILGDSPAQTVV